MSKAKEINSNQTLAVVIFSGFTIIFAAVFLSGRGEDVGRLPQFLSGLFDGNLFSTDGFGNSLLGVLIASLIAASWYGLGKLFTRSFERTNVFNALNFAVSCACGAAIWSLVWFFVGLANGYHKFTAIILLIVGLVLAIYFAAADWRSLKQEKSPNTLLGKIAFGSIIFTLLLSLVSALAPPTAKDALLYHLSVPKAFVAQGNNAIIEGNIASFLTLGAEVQTVWAMLLGNAFNLRTGETAAGATMFMFAPLLVLVIYGWAREFAIETDWAWLAALIVAAIPTFYYVASSGYVDLALALFVTVAIRSIGKWWTSLENKWLVYTAVALGAALSIKLTTAFVIAALALIVLLRARQEQSIDGNASENAGTGSIVAKGFGAFFIAALLASPWYLRTWAATGSPIFPFYMNLWKASATGWDAERSLLFQAINSAYGGADKSIFDYLLAPAKISLQAQPEIPQFYDGVLGVSFLLGLILIVWAWRQFDLPVEIKIAVGASGIVFLFWLFSSEQLRYLLPIMPSLAVATIVSANLISQTRNSLRKTFFAGLLMSALLGVLTGAAWFAAKNPLRVVLGGESREDYLTRQIDYYEYYKIINNDLPPDARIWLINMRRDSYHLDRAYLSDYMFEDWTLKKLVEESQNVNDLRQKARVLGVTHVLTRHDFLLDYKRTVIVDDRRAEKENLTKLKMTEDFVLDKANTIRADKKFSLVKLP
jgi:hypothetical protein